MHFARVPAGSIVSFKSMSIQVFRSIVLLLCCALLVSLQFDITPGELRCIGQELDQFEEAVFATSASSKTKGTRQKLNLIIRDPDEDPIFDEKVIIGAKTKELEYKIDKRGVYELCYELFEGSTPVRVFFHVDYKPNATESRKVGKDDMSGLDKQLEVMHTRIQDISREIEHARKQEIAMKEAGESTTWSVQWFSFLSIIILLATSLWQIIYLRTFFASKKLL